MYLKTRGIDCDARRRCYDEPQKCSELIRRRKGKFKETNMDDALPVNGPVDLLHLEMKKASGCELA